MPKVVEKSIDPFAEESYPGRIKQTLKQGERGTFVETAVANPIQGELVPYTRVNDLSEDLSLEELEDWQGVDLILYRADQHEGIEGSDGIKRPYLTLEVSSLSTPEHRFLVNCGGQDVVRKVKNAFQAIDEGKANPPLVAAFTRKRLNNGNTFWVLT